MQPDSSRDAGGQRQAKRVRPYSARSRCELACRADVAEGDRSLFRPGQLLLNRAAGRRFQAELEGLKGAPDPTFAERAKRAQLDLSLWRLPRSTDVLALVDWLRADAARAGEDRVVIGPNTVWRGEPKYHGGPGGQPRPAPEARMGGTGKEAPGQKGPDVAALDTGYVADLPTSLLQQLVPDTDDGDPLDVDGNGVLDTQNGHGSFVAGVIHRVAPELVIDPGRVLDSTGFGDDATVAVELFETAAPVINLSFGGYTEDDRAPVAMVEALRRLRATHVLVAAAGNNSSDRPFWPAALKGVVAVAAYDSRDGARRPARFSNYGHWVDVCAPGVDIVSTFAHFAAGPTGEPPEFAGWALWDGTSFAAPQVAALLAQKVRDGSTGPQAVTWLLDEMCSVVPELADYGLALEAPIDLTSSASGAGR